MILRSRRLVLLLALSSFSQLRAQTPASPGSNRPTLWLVGDLAQPDAGLEAIFNPALIKVAASPASGHTTRAYLESSAWQQVMSAIKPGDVVIIEFNANQALAQSQAAAQRELPGIGDGTEEYTAPGKDKVELIHSYGWYLRRLAVEAISHGARPILCSPPHPATGSSATAGEKDWVKAIAVEERIPFVDLGATAAGLTGPGLRAALEAAQPDPLSPYLARPAQ